MPLVQKLSSLFRSDAEHYVYARIPSGAAAQAETPLRRGRTISG